MNWKFFALTALGISVLLSACSRNNDENLDLGRGIFKFKNCGEIQAYQKGIQEKIERYYQTVIVQPAREKGQTVPPLDQVSQVIERDIVDQKVASEMTAWFEDARRHADIAVLYQP